MNHFGFKLVDTNPDSIEAIIDYAIRHCHPVEVGLYNRDSSAARLLTNRLANSDTPVNTHSDHLRHHVSNLNERLAEIESHIRVAKSIGSAYSILHITRRPPTTRIELTSRLIAMLADNLARAEELCEKHNFAFYLENVWGSIPFYRELFGAVVVRGFTRIHFCFDIGHAKVWSENRLDDWISFLDELRRDRFSIHMHLHTNCGFDDEHLSIGEARDFGIDLPDAFFNPYGFPEACWRLASTFPDAIKIFEVDQARAIANLETILCRDPRFSEG